MPAVAMYALGPVIFGMILGWAMKKTGSLWTAYLLHALNNLLVVVILTGPGRPL
jgi:membrane protease YdiL (CAAX protease family)